MRSQPEVFRGGLSGDLGGREDLQLSIEIAERIDSSLRPLPALRDAGRSRRWPRQPRPVLRVEQARGHAQRFGHASHIQWLRAERVAECYWTGLWDEALILADEIAGEGDVATRHFMEGYCRDMRGRIRLARNDVQGALEDAAEALSQARDSNEPQMLYPALAVCARALAAAGKHGEAARLADELLAEWRSKLNQFPASSWVVDLACALELLGREATRRGSRRRSQQLGVARRCHRLLSRRVRGRFGALRGDRLPPRRGFRPTPCRRDGRRDRRRHGCDRRGRPGAFLLPRRRGGCIPQPRG